MAIVYRLLTKLEWNVRYGREKIVVDTFTRGRRRIFRFVVLLVG